MKAARLDLLAVLFAAFIVSAKPSAQAETFGSGANTFTIEFVTVGNAGNPADTSGYGAVPYEYRIGKYEISQQQMVTARASGMNTNIIGFGGVGNQPATIIKWFAAAAFVNWLNTSTGRQAAYNITPLGGEGWAMNLWSSEEAWQTGGQNLFRHKDAHYFLPNENEWYKAAYFSPTSSNYFTYATGSGSAPVAVLSGTNAGTAVYNGSEQLNVTAAVTEAGGLSPIGTMAQSGNVAEWTESASDGVNSDPWETRAVRGGAWYGSEEMLRSSWRVPPPADGGGTGIGFRVASVAVPTPTTNLILTVEKTTSLSTQWQFDREINVGPMTNTNEFYRLKIRTDVE